MSMKNVSALVDRKENDMYKTADMVNEAGGKAWKMTDKERVTQAMFTGTMGNTYYVSQRNLVSEIVDLFKRCAKNEPKFFAETIVAGRNEGFIRSAPILGLAMLSKYDIDAFKGIFSDVIRTGNDMQDFMAMVRSLGRGFGRGIKTAMNDWIEKSANSFYAIKYSKQIGDAVRVSRPVTKDPIFDYIMNKCKGDEDQSEYLQKHVKKDKKVATRLKKAFKKYPQIEAHEKAIECLKDGDWDAACTLIEDADLNPTTLLAYGNPPTNVWKSLSKKMGTMMYLKYLNKLVSEDAILDSVLNSKINMTALKKAKVFPFRLYVAYSNVSDAKVRNHLANVLDQYVKEYDWGKWNKKFVIAPDTSGSMTWNSNTSVTPSTIAGMFSGILFKGLDDTVMVPWGSEAEIYNYPKADSVITHCDRIKNCNGGGTRLSAPVELMNKNKIKSDVCIFITDNMNWMDNYEQYFGRSSTTWLDEWKKYKKANPKAKAVLIRVDAYNSKQFDEATAEKYDLYQVFGWNDSVLSYIEKVVL